METIIMLVSFIAGIAGAFFLGVKIGHDRGYTEGSTEMRINLMKIYEEGLKERKRVEKDIETDCAWR